MALDDAHIPLTLKLYFEVANNETEYEVCIIRPQATIGLKTEAEDSSLVISWSNGKWKVKDQISLSRQTLIMQRNTTLERSPLD